MNVTVATWNVLADCYVRGQVRNAAAGSESTEAEITTLNESTPAHLRWKYRSTLIEQCFRECNADVLLLQEVDHFVDFYEPCLTELGYTSCYLQRPGRKDGCLIAFKSTKFTLIEECQVSLDESIDAESLYEQQKYQKQNVGLLLNLQETAAEKVLFVATCHVHWNPLLPEVKTSQVLYMLKRLQQFRGCDIAVPVILTGDFNTLPQDQIYPCINHPDNIALLTDMVTAHRFDGALYGPKTRFLCDASLSKLCKWMRVLGINVALDSWDNGVPASSNKHKNASKWQWTCAHNAKHKSTHKDAPPAGTVEVTHDTTGGNHNTTADAVAQQITSDDPSSWTAEQKAQYNKNHPNAPLGSSYAARVTSINNFFARAAREKRVILTTSKTLRERATCPRSFYVNPQDIEAGLIEICAQFGLGLSKERFLTVCGKCGDEVEEVSLQDPRLVDKYLPTDRTVFACVNCAQPYWWNEKAGSLPALAMEKAEQLYDIVCAGLQKRQTVKTIPTAAAVGDTNVGATVHQTDGFMNTAETVKPRVKAGTCILKDFGRTAKNPSLRNLGVSSAYSDSKRAELELEQHRLAHQTPPVNTEAAPPSSDGATTGEQSTDNASPVLVVHDHDVAEGCVECVAESEEFYSTCDLSVETVVEADVAEGDAVEQDITLSASIAAATISTAANGTTNVNGKAGGKPNTPQMSMETLTQLFANRERSLIESTSRTTSTGANTCASSGGPVDGNASATGAMSASTNGPSAALVDLQASFVALQDSSGRAGECTILPGLALHSVYQVSALQQLRQQHADVSVQVGAEVEPALTNWNGEFKGTLDYIFVSEQCRVNESPRVFPTIQANYPAGITLPAVVESNNMITQVVNTAQPSLVWPSDHFIVYATLHI